VTSWNILLKDVTLGSQVYGEKTEDKTFVSQLDDEAKNNWRSQKRRSFTNLKQQWLSSSEGILTL
jgi:hypothetical protein